MNKEKNHNMKKLLPVVLSLSTIATASAQLTITANDFASVGDNITFSVDEAPVTNFVQGTPGANKTWDFTVFNETATSSLQFVNPSTIPGGSTFTNANLAQTDGSSTIFLNKSNSGVQAVGTIQSFGGQSFNAPFNPAYNVLTFPLNYGDNMSGSYHFNEKMYLGIDTTVTVLFQTVNIKIDSVRIQRSTNISGTVDAWGVIEFNGGDMPVLRANLTQTNVDSTWAYLGSAINILTYNYPQGWNLIDQSMASALSMIDPNLGGMLGNATSTTTSNSLEFYSNNNKYRLAQIQLDASNNPSRVEWIQESALNLSNQNVEAMPDLKLFPNPTSGELSFNQSIPAGSTYRVINALGQVVDAKNIQSNTISVSSLANGNYTVILYNAKNEVLAIEKVAVVK